jgi:signal transduction histidine kinase
MRAVHYSWAWFVVTCLCLTTYLMLNAYPDGHLFSAASIAEGFPIIPLGVLLTALLGALILGRHPRHRIGWLLTVAAAGTSLNLATSAYGFRALTSPDADQVAIGQWAVWISQFFGVSYALAFTCALFLLVPDGRLASRRWRPVMMLLIASYALWAGVLLIGVSPHQVRPPDRTNPGPVAGDLQGLSTLMLVVAIAAATAGLVLRLHRSAGVQRQQLRWIMAAAALLAIGLVVVLLGYPTPGSPEQPWYANLPLYLGYTSVPIFTGIAVLRYRLYDLDVIISRAVLLALLTTFVTVGYVTVVVVIGAALGGRVAGAFWPSLVALVLVALAFQPLRHRMLRLADRLVYGSRAAPYEALAEFSRRLGRSPAPSDLLPALAEAVARSVGAARVRVTLDVPGTAGRSAAWPDGVDWTPHLELDVCDHDESLGRIGVSMPPGRALRPTERRLLQDFVAQAGVAFRNLRLDAELRARAEQLARQSAELAASRRRLLAARDDEQQRIAGLIERDVLARLRPIPAAIDALDVADTAAADEHLDQLEVATGAALTALREATRGLFPLILTRQGLVPALRAHLGRAGPTVVFDVAPALAHQRLTERTEAAAYFCAVALLARLGPAPARIALALDGGRLALEATGGALEPGDVNESAIVDRAEAAGGHITVEHDVQGRFRTRIEFPVPPAHVPDADAQTAASRSVPNADLAT